MEFWRSLPDDLRVSLLLCAGAAVPLVFLYLLGRLLTLRRPGSFLPIALAGGGALVMAAALSLFLDLQPTLPGIVEGKEETLSIDDTAWKHTLYLQVRYVPPGAETPRAVRLTTDPAIYDRVSQGDPVQVRHLHLGGWFSFARISDRTTFSILLGSNTALVITAVIVSLVMGIGLTTGRPRNALIGALVVVVAGGFMLIQPLHQWRTSVPLVGPQAQAVGTVRAIQTVTEVGGGDDSEPQGLLQPVDLVQVAFVPQGWRDPVLSADLIDSGSLALRPGDSVNLHYLTHAPRSLRLDGGARTYGWKNSLALLALPALLILLAAGFGLAAWLRRLDTSRQPASDPTSNA